MKERVRLEFTDETGNTTAVEMNNNHALEDTDNLKSLMASFLVAVGFHPMTVAVLIYEKKEDLD